MDQLVGKLGHGHAVIRTRFLIAFCRLGQKNKVLGHAWTVLGRSLETLKIHLSW